MATDYTLNDNDPKYANWTVGANWTIEKNWGWHEPYYWKLDVRETIAFVESRVKDLQKPF